MNGKKAKRLRKQVKAQTDDLNIPWSSYDLAVRDPNTGLIHKYQRKEGDSFWLRGLMIINTGVRSLYQKIKKDSKHV